MSMESWMYGDPEKVLERKQQIEAAKHRNCGRCVHKLVFETERETLFGCGKGREYGTPKCKFFRIETSRKDAPWQKK